MPEKLEPVRVNLEDALAGYHVLLDEDQLDIGLLEDIQSPQWKATIDGLSRCIVGGDLPYGATRDGIRRLKLSQLRALLRGVDGTYAVPKS